MDDKGIRDVLNVVPAAISGGLEALDIVGDENGDGGHVGVIHHAESKVRAGTWWVIINFEKVNQVISTSSLL